MIINYCEVVEASANAYEFFEVPGVVKHSRHGLRTGGSGSGYLDFDILVNDLSHSERVVQLYTNEIAGISTERRVDFLGFIEKGSGGTVGALRLATAISLRTRIPNILVRPGKDLHFERVKMAPSPTRLLRERLSGTQGVIITDHCTSGDEILKAIDAVEHAGGRITDVIAFTAYPARIRWKELEKRDVEFHPLFEVYSDEGSGQEVGFEIVRKGTVIYSRAIHTLG